MWHFKNLTLTQLKFLIIILTLTVFTACKDYYNDTIRWADSIKIGTDIQAVKNNQPDFIEIDWSEPETIGNSAIYLITRIKGSTDILKMTHHLTFEDNKYQGRRSRK